MVPHCHSLTPQLKLVSLMGVNHLARPGHRTQVIGHRSQDTGPQVLWKPINLSCVQAPRYKDSATNRKILG